MNWLPMPSPFPEITAWGAYAGEFTYVIGFNSSTHKWTASVKHRTYEHAIMLGYGATRTEAELLCNQHARVKAHH